MPSSNSLRRGRHGRDAAGYPFAADLAGPTGRVAMPRLRRLSAPGCTVHVVGQCNNREFCFTTAEDFGGLLAHPGDMARTYEVTLYAYTRMANHLHLLLQAALTEVGSAPALVLPREHPGLASRPGAPGALLGAAVPPTPSARPIR